MILGFERMHPYSGQYLVLRESVFEEGAGSPMLKSRCTRTITCAVRKSCDAFRLTHTNPVEQLRTLSALAGREQRFALCGLIRRTEQIFRRIDGAWYLVPLVRPAISNAKIQARNA
jgi:hypothetical protein